MFNISDFLEKFKKIGATKTSQKEQALAICNRTLSLSLPLEAITIKNNTLFFQGSPAIRSELYMKKEELKALLHEIGIVDIR